MYGGHRRDVCRLYLLAGDVITMQCPRSTLAVNVMTSVHRHMYGLGRTWFAQKGNWSQPPSLPNTIREGREELCKASQDRGNRRGLGQNPRKGGGRERFFLNGRKSKWRTPLSPSLSPMRNSAPATEETNGRLPGLTWYNGWQKKREGKKEGYH